MRALLLQQTAQQLLSSAGSRVLEAGRCLTETDCKMSSGKTEAERKFWRIPELVETLLPFLDVKSILSLAQCHQLTLNILQGTFVSLVYSSYI